jgi:hypothetical protein
VDVEKGLVYAGIGVAATLILSLFLTTVDDPVRKQAVIRAAYLLAFAMVLAAIGLGEGLESLLAAAPFVALAAFGTWRSVQVCPSCRSIQKRPWPFATICRRCGCALSEKKTPTPNGA